MTLLCRTLYVDVIFLLYYNKIAVDSFQQEGGILVDYIMRLIVSVMASVADYCIRKWLDRNFKDS